MKFSISSIFPEPGYSFMVSFKIKKLIVAKINQEIFENHWEGQHITYQLNAVVATNSKTEMLNVMGPDIDKKRKMIDYAIWMPYKSIAESDNYLKAYIDNLFIGLKEILNRCQINSDLLDNIKKSVEDDVINNSEYF